MSADLHPPYPPPSAVHRAHDGPYPLNNDVSYPPHHSIPPPSTSSTTPSSPESGASPVETTPKDVPAASPTTGSAAGGQRNEGKQQATFLTKLYALLEVQSNQHMIRWDPAGEHIIVEKPEQLAIHVLPSVYRQSRFASFSRQLNIYGFMRKVNLRNVDPAIDDPDASTWSHPTLNRHSSPEMVANFKRRVPPRIPKSKKRQEEQAAAAASHGQQNLSPRTAGAFGGLQQTMGGRARALTAPGSFQPMNGGPPVGWNGGYPRSALPPLDVPGHHGMPHGPGVFSHHPGYGHPGHPGHPSHASHHPMSPDDGPNFNPMQYPPPPQSREGMMLPPHGYPYSPENQWGSFNGNHSTGSLTSLLNPSGGPYPRPTINTYNGGYPPLGGAHSPSSPSDSRPTTGYSVSSATSVGYEDQKPFAHEYSRPGSSHHRQLSPGPGSRPGSSHAPPAFVGSLSVRRARRHSQAPSPYQLAYDGDGRPATSDGAHGGAHEQHQLSRMRSLGALASTAPHHEPAYGFNSSHGDFSYSAAGPMPGSGVGGGLEAVDVYSNTLRPSTSASSLSTASHASSQANTPPVTAGGPDTDINRFSPDFGFVPMHEQMPAYAKTAVAAL